MSESSAATGTGAGTGGEAKSEKFSILETASNEVQVAAEFWREFDIDGKRLSLDKQCVEMKELKAGIQILLLP